MAALCAGGTLQHPSLALSRALFQITLVVTDTQTLAAAELRAS